MLTRFCFSFHCLRSQLRPKGQQQPRKPKELTSTDIEFLGRMDFDIEDRRRTAFISELSVSIERLKHSHKS